jgi:hypothetical protein
MKSEKFNYDQKKVELADYLKPICLEYKGYSIKLYKDNKKKTFLIMSNDKGEIVLSCSKSTKISILNNVENRINYLESNK